MSNNHNFLALDWVKSEIEETLKQAQQALESYINNKSDVAQLRFCLAYLHQIYGTLQMVEFHGAALLAEEMEKLCLALLNNKALDNQKAFDVLIKAMLQLPVYLERLQVSKRDTPFVLLPTINSLRSAHDEVPLSEIALFQPDFSRVFAISAQTGAQPVPSVLKRLRHLYQVGLVGVIRQRDISHSYDHMLQALHLAGQFLAHKSLQALWQVAGALIEGLANRSIPLTPNVKNLLGEIEQELRKFITYPEQRPALDLLKNILYYVAKSQGTTSQIMAIRALYRLDEAMPAPERVEAEKEQLAAPDRQALKSVVKNLGEELTKVKDTIDDLMYADRPSVVVFEPLLPILKQVANTLHIMGWQPLQKIIEEQAAALAATVRNGVLPEGLLLNVAGGLLEVESGLQQIVEAQPLEGFSGTIADQLSSAQAAVLRESRTALEKSKELIVEYISSQWNPDLLSELPRLLSTVRGGLTMLDLARPAQMLTRLTEFVQQHLLRDSYRPSWSEMDTLADIISSIEYYLERIANHHQNNDLLDIAERGLEKLGYGLILVTPEPVVAPAPVKKVVEPIVLDEDETDRTLLHMPAIIVAVDEMPVIDAHEKTLLNVPAIDIPLADETMDIKTDATLLHMPALKLPEPVDVEPMQDLTVNHDFSDAVSDFDSTLSFDAEALLGDIDFKPKAKEPIVVVASTVVADVIPEAELAEQTMVASEETMVAAATVVDATITEVPVTPEATVVEAVVEAATMVQKVEELTPTFAPDETMSRQALKAEAKPTAPQARVLPPMPEDSHDEDDEIREIFIEEAEEVLETINSFFPKWAANVDNKNALTEFRRGFHTLKGSGRMVGAKVVGELAWSIENMLNRVIDKTATPTKVMTDLITEVINVLPALVNNFQQKEVPFIHTVPLMEVAENFAKGQSPTEEALKEAVALAHGQTIAVVEAEPVTETTVEELDVVADAAEVAPEVAEEFEIAAEDEFEISLIEAEPEPALVVDHEATIKLDVPVVAEMPVAVAEPALVVKPAPVVMALPAMPEDDFSQDDEIREIFIEEAAEVLETIHEYFPKWAANFDNKSALTEFRRGFHTLKGSGRMVGAKVVGELAWSIENMLNRVIDHTAKPTTVMAALIEQVVAVVPALIENFQNKELPSLHTGPLMALADSFAHAKDISMSQLEQAAAESQSGEATAVAETVVELMTEPAPEVAFAPETAATTDEESVPESEDFADAFDALAASLADMKAEPLPVAAAPASEDPVLMDIFISEARSYLQEIKAFLDTTTAASKPLVTDALLRALHTLRGSAGMAGVQAIFGIAGPMETLCKDLRNQSRPLTAYHLELLAAVHQFIQDSVLSVAKGGSGQVLGEQQLRSQIEQAMHEPTIEETVASAPVVNTAGLVAGFLDLGLDELLDAPWELNNWLSGDEREQHLQQLQQELQLLQPAAKASGIEPLAALITTLNHVYEAIRQDTEALLAQEDLLEALANAHDEVINIFDTLAAHQTVAPNPRLIERLAGWAVPDSAETTPAELDTDADPELLAIFLEEADEILEAADSELHAWQAHNYDDKASLRALQRHLHTLKGGARMAVVTSLGDLAHELEFLYEGLVNGLYSGNQVLNDLVQRCHDRLADMLIDLKANGQCKFARDLVEVISQYRQKPQDAVILDFFSPAAGGLIEAATEPAAIPEAPAASLVSETPPTTTAVIEQAVSETVAEEPTSGFDPEMLEIFLEEAQEIVDETNTKLQEWQQAPEDVKPVQILQRGLHTLKGGARMSGVVALGDLAHEMENIYEGVCQKRYHGTPAVFAVLQRCHDRIADSVDLLKEKGLCPPVNDLVVQLQRYLANPQQFQDQQPAPMVVAAPAPVAKAPEPVEPVVAMPAPVLSADELPSMLGNFRKLESAQQAAQEMIRVSSELMEKLINLAGEGSIIRSRVEMGVHGFAQTTEEMGATVQRLLDQLRRMEGELEDQILARHTQEGGKYEDFDPLEMDQYSALNQLSKSLYESASDLLDLKVTLIEKARDTETLLLQQSRLNTELQEGLMSSRMVPFSRLVPRLQRIVRQTSQELRKPAELMVVNAEGEMDRTLLERLVAPLEHMLRNAVDHGLEPSADRLQAGKELMGRVTLTLAREGGEVVLTLVDDGRGINTAAVRKKAIERGLLHEDTPISEQDLLQFIFNAGFSTAQQVTQISGRGVGMDVVQSEIKQLGGVISIQSEQGKGTTFTLRLPFTVAVSRALMVRIGEDVYAIPLSQIEGIVRASPYELETYYAPDAPPFEYANVHYKLHYLGEFVHGIRTPSLFAQTMPLPIMLIRGAEQRVAIQVDQLIGSREIVVKSVGAQLASVAGISGATILGDGSVVIILDMVAMLRAAAIQRPRQKQATALEPTEPVAVAAPTKSTRTVMVVDDSVTVRKVTSRLLERHGYEVILAKDGLDAITKLEDVRPDIMLLDIEMPRMDGFEVASLVRHNPNLVGLPIIMITSRTGEKHRERAFQIGVNCYMGKPFQEQQLLETISELLAASVDR